MRYKLPLDRLVNQLTPHYLGGRKYILFLQSLVYPLKGLNDKFMLFAKERHIEARMTSQVIYFEWFLNRKFEQYFVDKKDRIYIKDSETVGVDLYKEFAKNAKPFVVWQNLREADLTDDPLEKPREFYFSSEEKAINKVSYMVCVPRIQNISQKELVYMLSSVINTYNIAGKTYLIKIDTTPPDIPVSSVSLNKSALNLDVGDTAQLSVKVLPENATTKTIVWNTSNPSVATVIEGIVNAVGAGYAQITATVDSKSAVCELMVRTPVEKNQLSV